MLRMDGTSDGAVVSPESPPGLSILLGCEHGVGVTVTWSRLGESMCVASRPWSFSWVWT
jgi:hypothetical protein